MTVYAIALVGGGGAENGDVRTERERGRKQREKGRIKLQLGKKEHAPSSCSLIAAISTSRRGTSG